MAIAQWDVPFALQTPVGDATISPLTADATVGGYYILVPPLCEAYAPVRADEAKYDVPHQDGSILNDRWLAGYQMKLAVSYWEDPDGKPACDDLLVTMHDRLMKLVRSLPRANTVEDNRVLWTPSGEAQRMLDKIRLLGEPRVRMTEGGIVVCEFTVDTPFPYAISVAQTEPSIGTVTNNGTAPFYPVFKVTGGGAFTITNSTTGKSIVFTGSYGGSYAEVDCFRGTIYQDGSGANLKDGIDPTATDFFTIEPGSNSLTGGASGTVLLNDAWA